MVQVVDDETGSVGDGSSQARTAPRHHVAAYIHDGEIECLRHDNLPALPFAAAHRFTSNVTKNKLCTHAYSLYIQRWNACSKDQTLVPLGFLKGAPEKPVCVITIPKFHPKGSLYGTALRGTFVHNASQRRGVHLAIRDPWR